MYIRIIGRILEVIINGDAQCLFSSELTPLPRSSIIIIHIPPNLHLIPILRSTAASGTIRRRLLDRKLSINRQPSVGRSLLHRPGGQISPHLGTYHVRKVKPVQGRAPTQAIRCDVVGHRGCLGGGVGAEPEAVLRARDPDLRHPLPPFSLANAPELLLDWWAWASELLWATHSGKKNYQGDGAKGGRKVGIFIKVEVGKSQKGSSGVWGFVVNKIM